MYNLSANLINIIGLSISSILGSPFNKFNTISNSFELLFNDFRSLINLSKGIAVISEIPIFSSMLSSIFF